MAQPPLIQEGGKYMLRQRAKDGYPVGADDYLREAYGPIPDTDLFQDHKGYGYRKAEIIHGWQWSVTFNRWSALVTFPDGWRGYTYPKPETKFYDSTTNPSKQRHPNRRHCQLFKGGKYKKE